MSHVWNSVVFARKTTVIGPGVIVAGMSSSVMTELSAFLPVSSVMVRRTALVVMMKRVVKVNDVAAHVHVHIHACVHVINVQLNLISLGIRDTSISIYWSVFVTNLCICNNSMAMKKVFQLTQADEKHSSK